MGQSIKTSFAILVGFILVDNLLPKRFLQRSKVWLFGFVGVAALGPLLFYLCAETDTVDLFTGRERIWHEFLLNGYLILNILKSVWSLLWPHGNRWGHIMLFYLR